MARFRLGGPKEGISADSNCGCISNIGFILGFVDWKDLLEMPDGQN